MHAIVITGIMMITNHFITTKTPLRIVLDALAPLSFGLFGMACAASLHGRRTIVAILTILVLLCATPSTPEHLAALLVPVGIGVLVGAGLHQFMTEAE